MAKQSLIGWSVVALRPQGQHAALRRAAAVRGARLVALSPLRVEVLPVSVATLVALQAPLRLFTSVAAVRAVADHPALPPRRGQHTLAVGKTTAAALHRAGVTAVEVPERQDSEGLLALPTLARGAGRALGLITAPGGRGVLGPTLQARGFEVRVAAVYRRLAQRIPEGRWRALHGLRGRVAVVASSLEAVDALWAQAGETERARLQRWPWVVPSARLAAHLHALGLRATVAAGPQPAHLLDAVPTRRSRTLRS